MKRLITLLFAFVVMLSMMAQQEHKGRRREFSPEDFRRRMEEFITKDANLTSQEAQAFFPLLHEMFTKQRRINDEIRSLTMSVNGESTEEECAKIINKVSALEIENKELEKDYYKKFHSALSWKKIIKVRCSLHRFNMEALKRFAPPPRRQEKR